MKTFHLAVLSALLATSSSLFAQVKVTDQEYKAAAPVRAAQGRPAQPGPEAAFKATATPC